MSRNYFTVSTRYKLRGEVYLIRQILVEGKLQVENQSFGGVFTVSLSDLITAWANGDLIFVIPSLLSRPNQNASLGTEYTFSDFQNLPQRQRDEAWRRYQLILPLLKLPSSERSRRAIEAYLTQKIALSVPRQTSARPLEKARGGSVPLGQAVSRASVERWLYHFTESGYDIRALVPRLEGRGRKGKTRLDTELELILKAVFAECAANLVKRSANDVYLMIVNRIAQENRTRPEESTLTAPSEATIYRRIKATNPEILNRRKSRIEAQADAPVGDGPNPTRILERVEIDNTLLDLFIVDEEDGFPIGRPNLTYALDVYSGFPCGVYVGFEPPSYRTAAACLYHSIVPKGDVRRQYETTNEWLAYGQMETLVVDNGKDFTGADLSDACGQLGIVLEVLPVKTPWFKGSVERFFRTNNTGFIHSLPGTTFSNVLERGEYDSIQQACISLSGFRKLLHIFLLDVYAQKWHEGKQAIPYKRWQESFELGFAPVLHTSAEETRILLMRSETRTIQRAGIQFEWLFYRSPDLIRLRSQLPDGAEVRFKYDPGDISAIYVTDPSTSMRLRVPVARESLAYAKGLSLWKHRIINSYVRAQKHEVNIEALAAAKAKIQQIVAQEYARTRTNRRRKSAARFLGLGELDSTSSATPPALPLPSSTLPAPASQLQQEPQPQHETAPLSASEEPTKLPRIRRGSKAATSPSSTPESANSPDDFDMNGWGGDYQLPPTGGS